jgi:hypothetical protein
MERSILNQKWSSNWTDAIVKERESVSKLASMILTKRRAAAGGPGIQGLALAFPR